MNNPSVHKLIELVGTGNTLESAINLAISTASNTVHNLEWFKVAEIRGSIDDNKVGEFQVVLNVGFRLDSNNQQSNIDHHAAPKQAILSESPAIEAQKDFIDEGGNSQPLSIPEI